MELLFYILLNFAITAYIIASFWRIFSKAGEPGWTALIPIYDIIILFKITDKPWWWIFLLIVPILNIVLLIIVFHRLSKGFGQGVGFTLGFIFLPIIFFPLLGFGDYSYQTKEDIRISDV